MPKQWYIFLLGNHVPVRIVSNQDLIQLWKDTPPGECFELGADSTAGATVDGRFVPGAIAGMLCGGPIDATVVGGDQEG